jgi:hypothetical protein
MAITSAIRFRSVVSLLLLLTVLPARAEQTSRFLLNEPGTWKPWTFNLAASDLKLLGMTAADGKTFETRVKQIGDIFRASPIWSSPIGVDALITGSAGFPGNYTAYVKGLVKYRMIAGYLLMGSFEHYEIIHQTGGKETREHGVGDETLLIVFDVNRLPRGAGINNLSDAVGTIYEQPKRTADIGGFPTYGDLLVVATNGRPVWVPAPRERFLKAFIATHKPDALNAELYITEQQKQLNAFLDPAAAAARQAKYKAAVDKLASKGADAMEHERRYWERDEADTLATLKKGASHDPKENPIARVITGRKAAEDELAAMPPAERSGPACLAADRGNNTNSGLVAMGTPGCIPLVVHNPDFFDTTLPPNMPQILTAGQFRDLERVWKKGRPTESTDGNLGVWTAYEAFVKADWQKIASLIGK